MQGFTFKTTILFISKGDSNSKIKKKKDCD